MISGFTTFLTSNYIHNLEYIGANYDEKMGSKEHSHSWFSRQSGSVKPAKVAWVVAYSTIQPLGDSLT
jgi:hypothetical protein